LRTPHGVQVPTLTSIVDVDVDGVVAVVVVTEGPWGAMARGGAGGGGWERGKEDGAE